MFRLTAVALFLLTFANSAFGHFVFLVLDKDGKTLNVVFSETLEPDESVNLGPVVKLKLEVRSAASPRRHFENEESQIQLTAHEHHLSGPAPIKSVVAGSLNYGVVSRGDQSFLLKYHPKTILGDVPTKVHHLKLPKGGAEIVPERSADGLRFRVLFGDAPASKAEVTVLCPDGAQKKVETDADGWTPSFSATGRYGAWSRVVEEVAGEHDGKRFGQVRHYPTLVFDHSHFPQLPEAISSFGAAVDKDWVYVYGGHRAKVHTYDTTAVTGAWRRLNMSKPTAWEELPAGPPLQGLALVAHDGKLIRVGGMAPVNAPGEKVDMRSTDVCALYDPGTKSWRPLPPLPKPRSSHDAVVLGDLLIVVGGWNMLGTADSEWFDDLLVLDLRHPDGGWKSKPQPFQRRALQAGVYQSRVYVAGGLDEEGSIVGAVSVYDPASSKWSEAPQLPGGRKVGFNPGICTLNGRLYVSVGDGVVARLSLNGQTWEQVGKVAPRIVHRMVPAGDNTLLLLGGATQGDNLATVEAVRPEQK